VLQYLSEYNNISAMTTFLWILDVVGRRQLRSASRHHFTVPPRYRLEHVRAPLGLFGRCSYVVELFIGSSPWSNTRLL